MRDANATITAVITPGTLDEYGDPTTGSTAWSGRADCYLKRPRLGAVADRESDQRVDVAILPALGEDALQRALRSGTAAEASRVTVEDRRTGTVVERTYELVGLDARVGGTVADSIRLTLRREA